MQQNKSKWMWYKDDFELFHSHKLHARRSERGVIFPVQWCIPAVYNNVMFRKTGTLEKDETILVTINGIGHVRVNGELFPAGKPVVVPAGDYRLTVSVNNLYGLPCAYVEGDTLCSNETWNVGRGTGKCGCGIWVKAACRDDYMDKDVTPETFSFSYKKIEPISVTKHENGLLFDYGKETFATLCFKKLTKDVMDYMKTLPEMTIDIELKEYPIDGHDAIAYDVCDRVLKIVDEYGFTDRVVINSFSNKLNEYVREKYGNKYRQHVFYPMHKLKGEAAIDPYSYAYCCCVLGDKVIGTVISEQAACDYLTSRNVEPWGGAGIKDEATVDLAIERGVTLITCNNPDVVLELLRQKGKRAK